MAAAASSSAASVLVNLRVVSVIVLVPRACRNAAVDLLRPASARFQRRPRRTDRRLPLDEEGAPGAPKAERQRLAVKHLLADEFVDQPSELIARRPAQPALLPVACQTLDLARGDDGIGAKQRGADQEVVRQRLRRQDATVMRPALVKWLFP